MTSIWCQRRSCLFCGRKCLPQSTESETHTYSYTSASTLRNHPLGGIKTVKIQQETHNFPKSSNHVIDLKSRPPMPFAGQNSAALQRQLPPTAIYNLNRYESNRLDVSPWFSIFFSMTWSGLLWPLQRICDLCHSASQNCCLELWLSIFSITTTAFIDVHSTQQSTTTKQPKDVGSPADCLNMFQCYSIVPVPVSCWSISNQEPVMAFGAPSRSSAGGLPTVQHSTAFAYHGVDVWCVIP